MRYFSNLPLISAPDINNTSVAQVNLLARVSVVPALFLNPLLYYKYDIQEGDTPEIVATKYYGDPYRYWLVMFSNKIFDPHWDWPLSYRQFQLYINDKYGAAALANTQSALTYTQSTLKEYRKTIESEDTTTKNITTINYTIDSNTYNSTTSSSNTVVFSDGSVAKYTTTRSIVNIYDWETEQNEAKRVINLINNIYVGKIEEQFQSFFGKS